MKKFLSLFIFAPLAIALAFFFGSKAIAISQFLPEGSDYSRVTNNSDGYEGNPKLVLSIYGPYDNTLDSEYAYVKLYFDQPNNNYVDIHGASFCGYSNNIVANIFGNQVDGTTRSNTYYNIYGVNSEDNLGTPPELKAAALSTSYEHCNSDDYLRMNISNLQPSSFPGHEGKYVAILQAAIVRDPTENYAIFSSDGTYLGEKGAVNAFNVVAGNTSGGGAIAGQYALNSSTFTPDDPDTVGGGILTYQDRGAVIPPAGTNEIKGTYSNLVFRFAPNCNVPVAEQPGWLKWGNLEQETPLQLTRDASFSLIVRNRTTNNVVDIITHTPKMADDRAVQNLQFSVSRNFKYEWVWTNLQRDNALQIWMPFDSAEYGFDCEDDPDPEPEAWELVDETASFNGESGPGCAVALPGEEIQFGSTIRNQGNRPVFNSGGDLADIRINASEPSSQGRTLTYVSGVNNYNNVAIGANSVYLMPDITYRVPDDAVPGEVFTAYVTYLQALDGISPIPLGAPEARFWGYYNTGDTESPGPRRASACVEVSDFAFMKVLNSSAHNGAVWATYEQCQSTPQSLNFAQPLQSRMLDGVGTSAEYGVTSAVSSITGFASGASRSSLSRISPVNSLSFANNNSQLGDFLGGATSPAKCITDLYELFNRQELSEKEINTILNDGNNRGAGVDVEPVIAKVADDHSHTMSGTPVISGKSVILVDGDLNITSNVSYTGSYGSYPNLQIPSLVMVVKGDINIDPSVTNIDGLYMAIPDENGNGGNINTCSTFNNDAAGNAACSSATLIVNGAFVSRDADFYRFSHSYIESIGAINMGLGQTSYASEMISLSPEMYLSNPLYGLLNPTGETSNQGFDYYAERAPIY